MDYNKINIFGTAHWSARGSIDSDMWNWGLEIEKKDIPQENWLKDRTEEATNFVKELKSYFPDNYQERMQHPVHVPGDSLNLEIPLNDFKEPNKVYSILKNYFPKNLK